MKKKILTSLLVAASLIGVTSCGNEEENVSSSTESSQALASSEATSSSENSQSSDYSINIYDVDGLLLNTYTFDANSEKSAYELLLENADVEVDGTFINSVDSSFFEYGYYLAVTVNDEYSNVGFNEIDAKSGDVIDLKVTCWNTALSDDDIKLDIALHQYVRDYLKDSIKDDSLSDAMSDYWTYAGLKFIDELDVNGVNTSLKSEVEAYDLSNLNGTDYFKYYSVASAVGADLTAFKTAYTAYLDTISTEYSELQTPFLIAPAKELDIESTKINTLLDSSAPDLKGSYEWDGVTYEYTNDAYFWYYILESLYGNETSNEVLKTIANIEYDNAATLSLAISTFAAANKSITDSALYNEGVDSLLEQILSYYDEDLNLIKYSQYDTGVNMSTNQIYTNLFAYKMSRNGNKSQNIFA